MLEKLLKKPLKKLPEVELNKKAIDAGSFYISKMYKGAPLVEQQLVLNAISHGFFMGWRKHEEEMGAVDESK